MVLHEAGLPLKLEKRPDPVPAAGEVPVHETLIGAVEGMSEEHRVCWLRKLATLGAKAA